MIDSGMHVIYLYVTQGELMIYSPLLQCFAGCVYSRLGLVSHCMHMWLLVLRLAPSCKVCLYMSLDSNTDINVTESNLQMSLKLGASSEPLDNSTALYYLI
jgi:hypothetical protein